MGEGNQNSNSSLQTSTAGVGFTFKGTLPSGNDSSGLGSSLEDPRKSPSQNKSSSFFPPNQTAGFRSSDQESSELNSSFSSICGERMPPELCRKKRIEAAQANTTRYVGSLYEEVGQSKIRHIFLGGQRIASVINGKVSYYHGNHLGSTNVVTDDTGAIKELIEYEPWGTFSVHEKYATEGDEGSAAAVANFYFTGKPLDDETGLYYYGARYYNPVIGRFITPDTIVQSPGGNPQTLNRYSYVGNNPVNAIDPTGHKWSWGNFWKAIGIAIVGIVLTVMSAGTLTPLIGTYWAGVATGALTGATIGGSFAAATGGNIGMGILAGAVGGGVFAGLTPAFTGMMNAFYTGTTQVSLIGNAAAVSNIVSGALGGAASGAAVAGVTGADVGEAAWQGAAIAGTLATLTEASRYMRTKVTQQSRKNPLNSNGESGGGPFGDKTKNAGTRALKGATKLENCGPLGGCQGGQGEFFGIPYKPDSTLDYVHESFAGPHDYLSSFFLYDANGNGIPRQGLESVLSVSYSTAALPVSAPFAIAPIITQNGFTSSASIYGISSWRQEN